MKQILSSVAVIGFVGALVVGSTGAFFSDTETSANNTLTAGAIDLKIDNESYYNGLLNRETTWELSDLDEGHLFFNFGDLKPGDWGEDTISLHVNSNDAYACAYVTRTADDENTLVGPELEMQDDDVEGELDDELYFLWWADDGDNVLEEDERIINQGVLGSAPMEFPMTIVLADSNQNVWDETGPIVGGGEQEPIVYYIGKAWCYGEMEIVPAGPDQGVSPAEYPGFICHGGAVTNISQTDSTMLDVTFDAVQARHNDGFVCEGRPVNPVLPDALPTGEPL